jgi:cytochrome b561
MKGTAMPRTDAPVHAKSPALVYSPVARSFHWAVAALVLITAPIGFIMVDRINAKLPASMSDAAKAAYEATTNQMYSWHKLIGIVILGLMIARLTYRLMHGAPASEPTLTTVQKGVSHAVHWTLYALLLAIPVGGYLGIALGDYMDVFGVHLPNFGIAKDEKQSEAVFKLHGLAATVMLGLVALHLGAALYHLFVKGDGVVARMWPGMRGK